jgi:hypothetical protein
MSYQGGEKFFATFCMTAGMLLLSLAPLRAQDTAEDAPSNPQSSASTEDVRALADSVRALQEQVRTLNLQEAVS